MLFRLLESVSDLSKVFVLDRSLLNGGRLITTLLRATTCAHYGNEDYKRGKTAAAKALVGQVMKATGGRANPGVVNRLLEEKLSKI